MDQGTTINQLQMFKVLFNTTKDKVAHIDNTRKKLKICNHPICN